MKPEERIGWISAILIMSGWEEKIIDGKLYFKTPKDFYNEYWRAEIYKIWDAIHIQTMLDESQIEKKWLNIHHVRDGNMETY